MKKFMKILMISCKKATELIEKKLYFDLSFKEKVKLNIHTTMCNACKNYELQSIAIDEALQQYVEEIPPENTEYVPELKEKIKARIEKI